MTPTQSNDTTSRDDEKFWNKIENLAYIIQGKDDDSAEIAVNNLLAFINSTMTRNSKVKQYGDQRELDGRIDERIKVSYEHDSFTKEWFKDRVLDVKKWWGETAADAHKRRVQTLTALKDKENK